MRCPSCGFENPKGMKFCGQCASPLGRRCPQCGLTIRRDLPFAGNAPLRSRNSRQPLDPGPLTYTPSHLAEKVLTSKTALEGERKQVTVLFADLKGSMELLAERDPEEARHLLDPVLERMMDAVHRFESTVNQVMGDGIMALFGPLLPMRTTPSGRVTPRWPCRRRSNSMPPRCSAPKACPSTSGSG